MVQGAIADPLAELVSPANPPNPKDRYGKAKPSIQYVPLSAVLAEAEVMALGAGKYGPFNWRKDPIELETYLSAMFRHMASWQDGEDVDDESKISHLAHIRACAGIMIDAILAGTAIDNRPMVGPLGPVASKFIRDKTKDI